MANENQVVPLNNNLANEMNEIEDTINSKLVFALKNVQLDRIKVEVEMHKKLMAVELEYQALLSQFDTKRAAIVKGEIKPSDEECDYPHREADVKPVDPPADQKGIPKFWLTIFHNLEMFNDMVQLADEPVLEKLTDIRVVLLDQPQGFKLEFEFDENDYFTNKVLTKEYFYAESYDPKVPLEYDGPYISYTRGCTIDWKSPAKNLTKVTVTKKLRNKASNQVKTVEKVKPNDTFFNFFEPPTQRIEEVLPYGDDSAANPSHLEDVRQLLLSDFDIGETLRHNVVPRAVIYYTGEGIEDDEDYDEDGLDEFDEEDFDDDDEDDDEEEEEDEDEEEGEGGHKPGDRRSGGGGVHKKKGTAPKRKPRGGANDSAPAECKQQ